jgi:hypothetical protein
MVEKGRLICRIPQSPGDRQQLTGKEAKLDGDGRTFEEIARLIPSWRIRAIKLPARPCGKAPPIRYRRERRRIPVEQAG